MIYIFWLNTVYFQLPDFPKAIHYSMSKNTRTYSFLYISFGLD